MGKYNKIETAYFAGGCFWCLEAVFLRMKGIASVVSGFAGGAKDNPTYDDVATGRTGHAETVKIEYDQTIITYEDLLSIYFFIHDPTLLNRQGNDIGTQYRSAVFYANEEQKAAAEKFITELKDSGKYKKPIVTEVKPLVKFYLAEKNHTHYFENNLSDPYCAFVIAPKVEKFKNTFKKFYKEI
jgi:methionine-S-sulfoxide reductase